MNTSPPLPTIPALLAEQAKQRPEAIALAAPGGSSLTFAELWSRVEDLAQRLPRSGTDIPPRFALVLPNGPDMAVALLGVACAGTAAPLNPANTCEEFERYYQRLDVQAVLLNPESPDAARQAAAKQKLPVIELTGTFPSGPGLNEPRQPVAPVLQPDDTALVLLTSGSTGEPKRVPLTHRNILTSIPEICASIQLTPRDRVLCMWEQFHVGGLVDLLLAPLAAGSTVVCASGFETQAFFEMLEEEKPTWFQAVPTTLIEILAQTRRQGRSRIPSQLRFLRSVAAALSPANRQELEELFGVPVIQTYGMTEASPLITSTALPPLKTPEGSVGRSFGTEVAAMDAKSLPLPAGQIGELAIRGDNVMTGYEDDPEANQAAFRSGWFYTGDLGYLDEDGNLFLKGRIRELINRGGEKIFAQEVDEVLSRHPAIEQAAAFPIPHPTLGEDIAVAVVLHEEGALDAQAVRQFAGEHLSRFKIPQQVVFRTELPRGDTGKVKRRELSEQYKPSIRNPSPTKASTANEKLLAELWARELNLPEVGVDDNFFSLGGDSLAGVRVFLAIEKELGWTLTERLTNALSTVRDMARAYEDSRGDAPVVTQSPSLTGEEILTMRRVLAATGLQAALPGALVLRLHDAGADTPCFWCFNSPRKEMHPLTDALGTGHNLYGLYSGGGNLPDTEDMAQRLASHYAAEIARIAPSGPIHLGGNCRGAHVAGRLARLLLEQGREIVSLCLIDYFADFLYGYPNPMRILLGRNSDFRTYRKFHWGRPGWSRRFAVRPDVAWVDGGHGEYFTTDHVPDVADQIRRTLEGRAAKRSGSDFHIRLRHGLEDLPDALARRFVHLFVRTN